MPYVIFRDRLVLVRGMCARGKDYLKRKEDRYLEAHLKACADCRQWYEMTETGAWQGISIPVEGEMYVEAINHIDCTGDLGGVYLTSGIFPASPHPDGDGSPGPHRQE